MTAETNETDLSVVIPAYNEERRLAPTVEKVVAHLSAQPWTSELIVVDDGSTDRTAELARELLAHAPIPGRVLVNDSGSGVMRHADAGYETAVACAKRNGLNLPMIG